MIISVINHQLVTSVSDLVVVTSIYYNIYPIIERKERGKDIFYNNDNNIDDNNHKYVE